MKTKFDEFLNESTMGIDRVDEIIPDEKDYQRANGLDQQGKTFYGNGAPFTSSASKMAKLIKDKEKLVRRAKAVAATWGTRDYTGYSSGKPITENPWKPFADALEANGFTKEEIYLISRYRDDDRR
jgi:hypothetical protein